jgi:23S rRNA (guanosine2251-2'-O)-methyltransferase
MLRVMRTPDAQNSPPAAPSRDEAHALVLPGVKPVLELLEREPARVETLFLQKGMRSPESMRMLDLCRSSSVRFSLVDARTLHALCPCRHQGVVARLFSRNCAEFGDLLAGVRDAHLPVILALDQVQDAGNLGTLARTLHALGGAGLLVPRHNSAYAGPGAMRASAGALQNLPLCRVPNLGRALAAAAEAGIAIYGADAGHGSLDAWSVKLLMPALLVLGNENKGLRPSVARQCDALIHIPMRHGFNSLNVAQAGAMLLARFLGLRRPEAFQPVS